MNQKLVYLYDRLLLAIDGILACFGPRKKEGVLFVKLDQIGDFVIWLESAREFREFYVDKEITLMVNPIVAELASTQGLAGEIWAVDPKRLRRHVFYRVWIMWKVARRGFALAIQPTYSRKTFFGDSVVRVSQAMERIGFEGDLSNQTAAEKKMADTWYTRLIACPPNLVSELDLNSFFTAQTIGKACSLIAPWIELSDRERATKAIGNPYFVVVPGASNVGRQWPIRSFAGIAKELCNKMQWIPVILGSTNEVPLCNELDAELVDSGCINLVGSTDVLQMVSLIRHAKFVIANESGAAHIAAAVRTPSVCVLGGGHYGRFVPYPDWAKAHAPISVTHEMGCFGCNWRCSKGYKGSGCFPCIEAVDEIVVKHKVFSALVN